MKPIKTNLWWRLLFSFSLVGGAIALAYMLASRPISYVRYTSPPLPNGTRYTFLYPRNLNNVDDQANFTSHITEVQITRRISPFESFVTYHSGGFFPGIDETIQVEVGPGQDSPVPGSVYTRTDTDDSASGFLSHYVELYNPKSGASLSLHHMAGGTTRLHKAVGRNALVFRQVDKVIAGSFRVLPPGVEPPSP